MAHTVEPGQTYRSCQPTSVVDGQEVHTRIRVTGPNGARLIGYPKVTVVTVLPDGREIRPREIEVRKLYPTATTADGKRRRTGYYLDSTHA